MKNHSAFAFDSCFVRFENIEANALRNLIRDIVDDGLMSEGDDERRGGGDDALAREWIVTCMWFFPFKALCFTNKIVLDLGFTDRGLWF